MSIKFEAGRLKHFMNKWEEITSDKNILDIAQNCSIEFIDDIIPVQYPSSVRSVNANENYSNITEAEIKNLLDKKVIQEVTFVEGQFISPIFVRPKMNGEYRMILNLKKFNESVEYHHFKMDTLESVLNLIKPNSFCLCRLTSHILFCSNC